MLSLSAAAPCPSTIGCVGGLSLAFQLVASGLGNGRAGIGGGGALLGYQGAQLLDPRSDFCELLAAGEASAAMLLAPRWVGAKQALQSVGDLDTREILLRDARRAGRCASRAEESFVPAIHQRSDEIT
jgi:hypothetical protein